MTCTRFTHTHYTTLNTLDRARVGDFNGNSLLSPLSCLAHTHTYIYIIEGIRYIQPQELANATNQYLAIFLNWQNNGCK